jgi:DNA polymerase (family 10)
MDYSDDVLKTFDLVIASIHQNLKMDEAKATARLIKAIENPYTCILGHMTGRLILSRPGYPVDHRKVIDACAANRVAIELNANPWRLDIDHSHIPYAMEKGVLISIDPDAHSVEGIDDIHWGVVSARKGGLTKKMTLNAKGPEQFEEWLRSRKNKYA